MANESTPLDLDGGGPVHRVSTDLKRYAARDAAWQEHCAHCQLRTRYNSIAIGAMYDAFNAGWEARKRIVDYALDKLKAE